MPVPHKLPYRKVIADAVKDAAYKGLSVKDLLGRIARYQDAPTSRTGLLNIYGKEYWEGKSDFKYDIGDKIVKGIEGKFEGDPDFLMFAAKSSKGGWHEKQSFVEESLDEEETDSSVFNELSDMLGKKDD